MEQGLHLPYNTAWEYPRNQLEFIKILGSGAFGQVWLARAIDVYNWNNEEAMSEKRKRKSSIQEYIRKTSRCNNNKTNLHSFVAVKTLKGLLSEVFSTVFMLMIFNYTLKLKEKLWHLMEFASWFSEHNVMSMS